MNQNGIWYPNLLLTELGLSEIYSIVNIQLRELCNFLFYFKIPFFPAEHGHGEKKVKSPSPQQLCEKGHSWVAVFFLPDHLNSYLPECLGKFTVVPELLLSSCLGRNKVAEGSKRHKGSCSSKVEYTLTPSQPSCPGIKQSSLGHFAFTWAERLIPGRGRSQEGM